MRSTIKVLVFHILNSHLSIRNTSFKNNSGTAIKGVGYLDIDSGHFIKNKPLSFGLVAWTTRSLRHVDYNNYQLSVQISRSHFEDNIFPGQAWHVKSIEITAYIDNSTITVKNCSFKNNWYPDAQPNATEDMGAAISLLHGDGINVTSMIQHTTFHNNSANFGGAIYCEGNLIVLFCNFTSNHAQYGGGAISGHTRDLNNFKYHNALIQHSYFENNSASIGGALYYLGTNLNVSYSNFTLNAATIGGAVYVFQHDCLTTIVSLNISHVVFNDSRGIIHNPLRMNVSSSLGNSLYASGYDIYGTNITVTSKIDPIILMRPTLNSYEAIFVGAEFTIIDSNLVLHNTSLNFSLTTTEHEYIDYFHFLEGGPANGITMKVTGFSLTCPTGYKPKLSLRMDSTDSNPYEKTCQTDNSSKLACTYKSDFAYGCELPASGLYIPGRGEYNTYHSNETYSSSDPKACPIPGGNCTKGLRPLDGYWGPLIETESARFIKCVPEFCCTGSDCVDNTSCNYEAHRTGILCTECNAGYSESMFSEICVPDNECGNHWVLILIIASIIFVVILSVLGVLPLVTKYYGLLMLISKGIKEMSGQTRARDLGPVRRNPRIQVFGGHTADGGDIPEIEDIENETHGEAEKARARAIFITCVVLIFYYSQDVTLYHVDLTPYHFPFLYRFMNIRTIRKVYSLNVGALETIAKITCIVKNLSPIGKVLLNISVYPLIYLTFGLVYLALILFKFSRRPHNTCERSCQIKRNLATGFVLIAMLAYQKITAAVLRLVNCVEVHKYVLLIDSNTECSQTKLFWVYIIFCLIPFPLYLMFVIGKLAKKRLSITAFNFGLVLPGVFFIHWVVTFAWSVFHARILKRNRVKQNESESLLRDDSTEDTPSQHYVSLSEVDHEVRPESGKCHELNEELCHHVQGGCYKVYMQGCFNWAGFALLLRMILVFFSVFIHDPVSRIGAMLLVSFLSFASHAIIRPCQSVALNVIAILCQGAIVVVGICYLIVATLLRNQYQVPEDDPITQVLKILIYIFSVIIPALCIFIVLIDSAVSILIFLLTFFGEGMYKVGKKLGGMIECLTEKYRAHRSSD